MDTHLKTGVGLKVGHDARKEQAYRARIAPVGDCPEELLKSQMVRRGVQPHRREAGGGDGGQKCWPRATVQSVQQVLIAWLWHICMQAYFTKLVSLVDHNAKLCTSETLLYLVQIHYVKRW